MLDRLDGILDRLDRDGIRVRVGAGGLTTHGSGDRIRLSMDVIRTLYDIHRMHPEEVETAIASRRSRA